MESLRRDFNLQPMWTVLMSIVREFELVCKRHGLRYYFFYGSAIGVIRHRGFIPWDDDIDIVMPRPDYERFVDVAPRELPAHLKVLSRRLDSNYMHVFNKVQLLDQEVVERVKKETKLNLIQGIYVDFFPIDGSPRSRIGRHLYWLKRYCLRSMGLFLELRDEHRFSFRYAIHYIFGAIAWLFHRDVKTKRDVLDVIERWAMSFPFSDDHYSNYYQEKAYYFPPGSFGEPQMLPFDGYGLVPLPAKADEILRMQYGDYMKLPPVSERVPSHQVL